MRRVTTDQGTYRKKEKKMRIVIATLIAIGVAACLMATDNSALAGTVKVKAPVKVVVPSSKNTTVLEKVKPDLAAKVKSVLGGK
jgi:hypothetical protein